METNEYRRSLIMLRSLEKGYSGHARLEIRTLTGFLNIVTSIPANAHNVNAVLAGSCRNTYFAVPLGALRRDLRGQAALSVTFDPRSIGGRTIDAYTHLVLVNTDSRCTPVLAGNLCGSRFPNWPELTSAVCRLYAVPPEAEPPLPPPMPRSTETPSQTDPADALPLSDDPNPSPSETIAEQDSPEYPNAHDDHIIHDDPHSEVLSAPDDLTLSWPTLPQDESPVPAFLPVSSDPYTDSETASQPPSEKTSQSLHSSPANLEDHDISGGAVSDRPFTRAGWKFTRVNFPDGCTFSHSYVGVPEKSEAPAEICCAIPAVYTPEPPPGLDDYEWSGGSHDGWWIKCYIAR